MLSYQETHIRANVKKKKKIKEIIKRRTQQLKLVRYARTRPHCNYPRLSHTLSSNHSSRQLGDHPAAQSHRVPRGRIITRIHTSSHSRTTSRAVIMSTSSQSICCDANGAKVSRTSNRPKSPREIIFGWDRFNSLAFALVAFSFAVWCVAYFTAYKPMPEDEHAGAAGGHEGHGGHEGMEHHGMQHWKRTR